MPSEQPDDDQWQQDVEGRLKKLEIQSQLDTLALAVAHHEATIILFSVRRMLDERVTARGDYVASPYLKVIERASQRILNEIDHTNQRPESVQEVSDSMELRQQDPNELPTEEAD